MITPIGVAIIVFAVVSCLFFPGRLRQAIVFFSSFSATAVVNFSDYGMSPATVFLPCYLAWKLMSGDGLRPVRVSRDHMFIYLLIVCFGVISVFSLLINQALRGVEMIQVTQTAYVLFGIIITLVLAIDFAQPDRLEAAIRALRASAVFVSLWGIVQAACFYTGIPYPDLFNNSTSHFADLFDQQVGDSVIRLASVATEPSFLAVSLMIFASFGATLIATEPRFRRRGWIIPTALALIVTAASTSTTGYFALFVLILLLGTTRPLLTLAVAGSCALAVSLLFVTFPGVGDLIYDFTFAKADSGSYADRSQSTVEAVSAIAQHPLLGWGWGANSSYSIATQLMTSTGAIGTACFAAAAVATIVASRSARGRASQNSDWHLAAYARGAENAMIVFFAESVVSGFHFVVADFWCVWALAIAIPSCLTGASLRPHAAVARPFLPNIRSTQRYP